MLKVKKSGFTLVEVILACSIFAIVVSGIVLAINRSYAFMNNIRLVVRATNFAREGMEMMYNIRDTNWRKNSGWRDNLWLYLGTGAISQNGESSNIFVKGIYVLKEEEFDDNGIKNKYFYAKHESNSWNNCYSDDKFWSSDCDNLRKYAKIEFCDELSSDKKTCKTYSTYSYYDEKDDKQYGSVQDALIGDGLEFYRIVRVFGIYKKGEKEHYSTEPQIPLSSEEASYTATKDGTPAEMRFCVKVFYRGNGQHSSELCGIMTNFME